MKKQYTMVLVFAVMVQMAIGGIICSGDSASVAIDSRTGVRESDGNETLTYSSLWDGNASATVTIAQDGVAMVGGLTGDGERLWSAHAGTYVLTHTTYANGVASKTESATFKVITELTSNMVASIADVTYTGAALTPLPVVTDSARGVTLVNRTDYTLSYANNVSAGTATVTVTGKGNYRGSIQKTFTIARRNISDATITLGDGLTYNGELQMQSISSVNAGGLTVTYSTSGNRATAAGTYTLTVTGTGNFTGTVTKQYTIACKNISGATVTLGSSLTYTGAVQSQGVSSVTIDGLNATFSVSGNSATAAGTYTLTVTGTGNFTGTATKTFTVAKATYDMSGAMWSYSSPFTYDGNVHSVTLGDLPSGVSVASYTNNSKAAAGDYTATATLNYDSVNYNMPMAPSCAWAIEKAVVEVPPISSHVFDGIECLAVVEPSALYSVISNLCDFSTGVYKVELALTDPSNYSWRDADGTILLLTGQVVNLVIADGVTEIGRDAFNGWTELRTVDIPDSVTRIGPGAFAGCTSLLSIDLPEGLVDWGLGSLPPAMLNGLTYGADGLLIVDGWLLDCQDRTLTSLTVPEGVVGIGNYALAGMTDLHAVLLSTTLVHIADSAFRECTYLGDLALPDSVETIAPNAFADCSYLQNLAPMDAVKTVGDRAFAGCTQLAGVSFGQGLMAIGAEAFSNCWRMASVSLPLSTTNVASTAFKSCTSLTGVTVPTHGGKMSEWFTPVYSQITDITVPDGETEVRADMFAGCSRLASMSLPEGVTNIAARAFKGCSSLPGTTLPATCEALGEEAFANCSSLAAMVLPESVACIGASVFSGCSSLATLTLSRSLTEIPERAFAGCSSLDSFVVPAAVTSLGTRFVPYRTTAIYYLGNAPSCVADVYADSCSGLTSYVVQGTIGWDGRPTSRDIPQSWNGRNITTWTANRFDVTFDAAGGRFPYVDATTYSCEQVTDTAYALPPFEPVRAGYTFRGYWSAETGGTCITASTRVTLTKAHTLYARWSADAPVTVRFNAVGGTVSPTNGEYALGVPYGTLPVPTREHYEFAGWYTDASGGARTTEATEVPAANHDLFAHWTPCVYLIRYNACGGSGYMADQSFTYGTTVTLTSNAFSKVNHNFVGWAIVEGGEAVYADGRTLTEVAALQNGVINLYAVWSLDQYSVRFDSNGGTGQMDNQTFTVGTAQQLSPCLFSRTGYAFIGWGDIPGGEAIYADRQSVSNLTTTANATVVLYAIWWQKMVAAPVVTPGAGATFTEDSCTVTITCATEGAAIYYSTDGSTPRPSNRYMYTGPFTITDTAEICAFAVADDVSSDFTTVTITKTEPVVLMLAGVLDVPAQAVTTGGDAYWTPVEDATAAGGSSARSGAIAPEESTWMAMTVSGAGTLSFNWKADCEKDPRNRYSYDFGAFAVDGNVTNRIDGTTAWQTVTVEIAGTGMHVFRWTYSKDDYDEEDYAGEDCIWVDHVVWTPSVAAGVPVDMGGGKTVTVPLAWFDSHPALLAAAGGDAAAALQATAANGRMSVAECYVVGVDPEKADEGFKITSFPMKADGTPDLANLEFEPTQDKWNVSGAQPVIKGAAALGGEWQTVTDENKAGFRFFKVVVELP